MQTNQHNLYGQTLLNIDFQMQLPYETSAISKLHVKSTYHKTMVMSKKYYTFLYNCYDISESIVPGSTQKQNH